MSRRLASVVAALACASAIAAQGRLLGLVRTDDGRPLAGATVRAFAAARVALPWLDAPPTAPVATRTDAGGRFSLPGVDRAALWIEGDGGAAFVPDAAPGVPVLVATHVPAAVKLGDGARGAHVRIDGIDVGFVPGAALRLPAAAVELLVEHDAGPFVVALRLEPGADRSVSRPRAGAARVRDVPAATTARVLPWHAPELAPDATGTLLLPASDRPLAIRLATRGPELTTFDDLWLTPGTERRADLPEPRCGAVRVVDERGAPVAGAAVLSVRAGPGPVRCVARGTTDRDGNARVRLDQELPRVVVVAESFALAACRPEDRVVDVRLERARVAHLRVVGPDGLALAGAAVATRIDPALDQAATTDARGGVTFDRLPGGAVAFRVDHPEFVPLVRRFEPSPDRADEITLEPGLALRGSITCSERPSVAGTSVEVRGTWDGEPLLRRAVAAADGSFVVHGLPDVPVRVFAWCAEDGLTWSGAAPPVRPGGVRVELEITCDDPQPGAGGRSDRRAP